MAPEDRRRPPVAGRPNRAPASGWRAPALPWLVAGLGVLAFVAVWFLWPVLRVVAILAFDVVLFAILGGIAYFYLRRLRRRRKEAAEEEALATEEGPPPPAEQPEEAAPPQEEPSPAPAPERDRAAEVEAKLQAIKRRLGKE